MLGKAATAGIAAFWLIMMTLLVQREILPAYAAFRQEQVTPGYSRIKELAQQGYSTQMGIYLGDRKIGYTRAKLVDLPADEIVEIVNTTQISLNMSVGSVVPGMKAEALALKLNFKAQVGEDGLHGFRLDVFSKGAGAPLAIVDGKPIGETLSLKIHTGDQTRLEQVPFHANTILGNDMGPMVLPPKLSEGVKWPVRSLDPMTYTVRTAWATVRGKETIAIEGRDVKAYLITIPYGTADFKVWADENGEVLKQKFLGFSFVKEPVDTTDEAEGWND
jgi:hypothetical protein